MRFTMTTLVMVVASVLLVAQVAAADPVQEQLRLMEERMAAMEDRLQSTSDDLRTAQATVSEQQTLLTESGLIEADDSGIRSGVGGFMDMVDVSGVVAASFNYRLMDSNTDANSSNNFKTPNANTFQVDQVWISLDKTPTDESRGGFHAEFVAGTSAMSQGAADDQTVYLYTAYASYLAPIGSGIQIDMGRLATPLGAEVVQTNGNFFVTQGMVFGLQPVTHTGISFSTQISDELGLIFGVANDVYDDTFVSTDNDKAYYGQLSYSGDMFGLNIGGIWGEDGGSCGNAPGNAQCETSVVDVVLTADPTENLSVWANFDWKHTSGNDTRLHGDAFGISVAGRLGITDTMGVSTRIEYVTTEDSLNGDGTGTGTSTDRDGETFSLTGTVDKALAEGLVGKLELRWNTILDDNNNGMADFNGGNNDELIALMQMYYEF